MRIFKRKAVTEAERLSEHYRKDVFDGAVLDNLTHEDFASLVKVASYADFGVWTAIEAAFCLGYGKGKGGVGE